MGYGSSTSPRREPYRLDQTIAVDVLLEHLRLDHALGIRRSREDFCGVYMQSTEATGECASSLDPMPYRVYYCCLLFEKNKSLDREAFCGYEISFSPSNKSVGTE
jgi:hypothetical protein